MLNACRKTVTSLALAGDGRFLATGECGHMPNVRVWDISDPYNAVQFAEFSGHKYGINCVVSSKRGKPATCSQKSIAIDYARIVKTKPEKLRSGECSERIDESFFLLIDRLINHICISFAISLTVSASAYSIVNQILSLSFCLDNSTAEITPNIVGNFCFSDRYVGSGSASCLSVTRICITRQGNKALNSRVRFVSPRGI